MLKDRKQAALWVKHVGGEQAEQWPSCLWDTYKAFLRGKEMEDEKKKKGVFVSSPASYVCLIMHKLTVLSCHM